MTIDDEKLRLWLEAAVESAFRAGASEERAAVVAFLRARVTDTVRSEDDLDYALAVIERGAHRREEER